MQTIQLDKTTNFDLWAVQRAMLYIQYLTADKVSLKVADGLNLTQEQIDVLQNIVNNADTLSRELVRVDLAELYDGLDATNIQNLLNDDLFKSLTSTKDYIDFKLNFANTFLNYLTDNSVVDNDSVTTIKNLLITKGLALE